MSFLTVFVRPPGDLIYFMLILATLLVCALIAVGQHLRRGSRVTSRLTTGLVGALVAWLIAMGALLASAISNGGDGALAEAVERGANLLMLIALGWTFITAETDSFDARADMVARGLVIGVIALLVLTGGQLADGIASAPTIIAVIWLVVPILLLAAGIAFAVINRDLVTDLPLKLVFGVILLGGYAAGLLQYVQNDPVGILGTARLAYAAALGIAAVIVYRALMSTLVDQIRTLETIVKRPTPVAPVERTPAAPRIPTTGERESLQLLRALGLMIEDTRPAAVPNQVVRAALEMLRADIGALIRVQDANYADIIVGFDRSRKRSISGLALNLNDQPTLQNVIERLQQRPLFPDRNQAELDDLYTRLSVDQSGPAYFQPLARDGQLMGILLIGFPFSDRELTEPESEALKGLGVIAAGLLAISDAAEDARLLAEERAIQAMVVGVPLSQLTDEEVLQARQSALTELQKARGDIDMLTTHVRQLEDRVALERERLMMALGDTDADMSISQRVNAVGQAQARLREERDMLAERLRQMESVLGGASEGDEVALRNLIGSLQHERDDLVSQRQRLEGQLDELRTAALSPNNREMASAVVKSLDSDQSKLQADRDNLRAKFEQLQAQLAKFGVDGSPSGIAQLISQLYSERASLMGRITTLAAEKETLAQERQKLGRRLAQLRDSEAKMTALQREIANLSGDLESAVKQRDALKQQRDELVSRFEAVKKFRERVVERITMLENQLRENQEHYAELAISGQGGDPSRGDGPLFLELNRATSRIVELERELNSLRGTDGSRPMTTEEAETLTGLVQELRTPITSMRGYVDLMLRESVGILGDTQRKFLQRVAVNVSRLSNMIEDVVRVAALDAGRVRLEREEFDFLVAVEEAVTELTLPLREKGIELSLELPDALIHVNGDREAIKHVALQLLTNAYLAAPPKSVMRVKVEPRDFPGVDGKQYTGVLLAVEDEGGGVAPEDLTRVFQKRFNGENPLVPGLGDTGVGLAIAKSLVEMHNGQIWVESQPGAGTRINVLLAAMPI